MTDDVRSEPVCTVDIGDAGVCGEPIRDNAYLCRKHTGQLRGIIAHIPEAARDLELTITRQTTIRRPVGTGEDTDPARTLDSPWLGVHEQGSAFDVAASQVRDDLRSTVVGWVRHVADLYGGEWPADRLDAMCPWLLAHVDGLRRHPEAVEALDELGVALRRARRVVDSPERRAWAGLCDGQGAAVPTDGCGDDLTARLGAAETSCRTCGASYAVADRLDRMLAGVNDRLATAATVERALPSWGIPVTARNVRDWKYRGRIIVRGYTGAGQPLYRIGDVIDLARDSQRKAG